MADDFEIKGLLELKQRLKKLPKEIAQKVAQPAANAAAKVFVEPAKAAAPKDSGDMASTIKSRKYRTKSDYIVAASVRPRKGGGVDPYYWKFPELGSVLQPPQPFLRPAFDGNVEAAGEAFRQACIRGLKRYGG